MSNKYALGLAATAAILLSACGDEITEVTETTGMAIVEAGEDLPNCTKDNEGAMVYAVDSAAAYFCVDREWNSLKGKDGEDGKDGKDGEKGDKGDTGKKGDKGDTGDKGDQGEQGEKGDKGEQGAGCSVEDTGDGYALVTCGEGENATTTKMFKSMCGGTPYNPASQLCDFRDSTIYKYVTIGSQTWMAENLRYKTAGSHCYNDSAEYCSRYGRYYTWGDAMDSAAVFSDNGKGCGDGKTCTITNPARGICPEGWHMPDSTEWETLLSVVGRDQKAYVAKGLEEWPSATDEYGFSALPVGAVYDEKFNPGNNAYFWCATDGNEMFACTMLIGQSFPVYVNYRTPYGYRKSYGLSVRCIKD